MKTSRARFFVRALVSLALAGCMGPTFVVQQYSGKPRPRDAIAILRANARDEARVLVLDGEDIAAPIVEDGRLHIEILPARHVVAVGRMTEPRKHSPELAFQADADHVYRAVFVDGEPRVYEVDRSSDKLVRDVTIARPEAAPEPPAPAAPAAAPPPPTPDPAPPEP